MTDKKRPNEEPKREAKQGAKRTSKNGGYTIPVQMS
jgi:hypothetical protein